MTGSPASRGATASVAGAGRACLGAASARTVNAAIAASVAMARALQRRIPTVDRAIINRYAMPVSSPRQRRRFVRQVAQASLIYRSEEHTPELQSRFGIW